MSRFLKLQLNRACYVSLLDANDIKSGVIEFKHYMKRLNLFMLNPFYLKKCLKEKKQARDIFIEKIKKEAKKHFDEKNYQEALKLYKIIFDVDSKDVENIKNYIAALEKTEQFDLQFGLAKYLVKIDKSAENYKLLSEACKLIKDFKKAILFFEKALSIDKKTELDANENTKLGFLYFNYYTTFTHNPLHIKKASECFEAALKSSPNNKGYLMNAIFGTRQQKDYEAEKKHWEVYFKNNHADKNDEFIYSSSCCLRGDIPEWEKYYEARYLKPASISNYQTTDKPRYDGTQDIHDKTLLVLCEQGFGDTFLMYGYMQRLAKIAKKVIFYVQNSTYELLKNSDENIEIQCAKTKKKEEIEHDYFMLCMSIPNVLKLTKENLSVGAGYIKTDEALVEKYKKEYFNNQKLKIGIAFLGNKNGQQKRDIPLKKLALLDKLKDVQFYCFTKDVEDKELKIFKRNKVVNIAKSFDDFAHTAAALECCDLVISSDNCILNLAGAIGKKTLGVFNYHYEFRWYDLNENDCGWFKTVKPFVNDIYNNWDKTLGRVIEEVEIIKKNG